MAELPLIREPIGLRVLIRALRPDDREPFTLWRAAPHIETEALIEAGEEPERARLWAALLRWKEAHAVAAELTDQDWQVTLRGVRAIALARAVTVLQPPTQEQGWTLKVGQLTLQAVPEMQPAHDEELVRLLDFLDG